MYGPQEAVMRPDALAGDRRAHSLASHRQTSVMGEAAAVGPKNHDGLCFP
jgi:hypothetical protein